MQRLKCFRVERRLALGLAIDGAALSAHVAGCSTCESALAAYGRVKAGVSALADDERGSRLAAPRRARILLKTRDLPATPVWGTLSSKAPAFATLLATFVIIGFAYLASYTPVQDLSPQPPRQLGRISGPTDLKVVQEGNDVVLEWSDGAKESYTVRQAASAKAVYTSAGVQVRGHRYVDRSPSDATVVYYLVE